MGHERAPVLMDVLGMFAFNTFQLKLFNTMALFMGDQTNAC